MSKIVFLCDSHNGVEDFIETFKNYFILHISGEESDRYKIISLLKNLKSFLTSAQFEQGYKKNLWLELLKLYVTVTAEGNKSIERGGVIEFDCPTVLFDVFQPDTIQELKNKGFIVVLLKNTEKGRVFKTLEKEFGAVREEEVPNLTIKLPENVESDYCHEFDFSDIKQSKKVILSILSKLS